MDGQEEAAICLGEVSDSEEEGEGGWPTGWERERAGSPASWEGGGRVPQLGWGSEEVSCLKPELPALAREQPTMWRKRYEGILWKSGPCLAPIQG